MKERDREGREGEEGEQKQIKVWNGNRASDLVRPKVKMCYWVLK